MTMQTVEQFRLFILLYKSYSKYKKKLQNLYKNKHTLNYK